MPRQEHHALRTLRLVRWSAVLGVAWSFGPSPALAETIDYRSPEAQAATLAQALEASEHWSTSNPDWVRPVEPHRVAGNVYSVGTEGLGIYLLTGDDGHVLIDGGMPGHEAQVVEAIEKLGFRIEDVRLLLNSHAHFDHSGGLAVLKERTGAPLWSSEPDREALETGRYAGSEDAVLMTAPPVSVDRTFADGEVLRLGSIELIAHVTAGHSPGCTTFTTTVEGTDGSPLDVLFFCSATVAANRLADPPQYPGIVADYRRTFERLGGFTPDVPLSNHPFFLAQAGKAEAALAGEADAYVDRERFPALIDRLRADFEQRLPHAEE